MRARTCLAPLALLPLLATAPAAIATPASPLGAWVCDDAYLGVYIGDSEEGGATVTEVIDGTPAAKADLRAGDRIVAFDGRRVDDVEELIEQVAAHRPGDEVEVVFYRDGEKRTKEVRLEAQDRAPEGAFGIPRGAFRVAPRELTFETPGFEVRVPEGFREDFARDWERLLERRSTDMERWAVRFEERMAELRARMEDRWSQIGEGLDRFEDEHVTDRRDDFHRRMQELRERLDADLGERLERLEGLQERMRELGHDAEHRIRVRGTGSEAEREDLRRLIEERLQQRWEHPRSGRLRIGEETLEYDDADEKLRQIEELREENRALRQQVEDLRAKLGDLR